MRPVSGPFLQLETVDKTKDYAKMVYILTPNARISTFRLGRGPEIEVHIPDLSISKVHAQVTLTPQGYRLADSGSKFGTLLLLPPGPHHIDPIYGMFVQVNRTTLTIFVKKADRIPKLRRAIPLLDIEDDIPPPNGNSKPLYYSA